MKLNLFHRFVAAWSIALSVLAVSCDSKKARDPDTAAVKGDEDRSLVLSKKFGDVENGTAFDKAVVEVTEYKKIVLPDNAEVRQDGNPGKLRIFTKKTLAFFGHPPEPMSIREARKYMGCAVQAERDALVVATFGEWDSHIEGGARMKLLFVVPKGLEVERRANLSGENSVGREWGGKWLTKPKEVKEGYWYGPATPGEGWEAVAAVPDNERKAE